MLEAYIGSVIGSIVLELISTKSIELKIKKNGYAFDKSNDTFIEKLINCLEFILVNCIPVVNVVISMFILAINANESRLEEFQSSLLKKGFIHKTEELLAKEEAEKLANIEHDLTRQSLDTLNEDVVNKYSMMSDAEKLAFLKEERERILDTSKTEKPVQKVKK